jgi:PAS domain S-box-containing protein
LIRLADGKHLVVNQASTRIYGYSAEEFRQRSNQDLHLWVNRHQRIEYLRRLRSEGTVRDMEAQLRAKDGRILTLLLSAERVEVGGEECIIAISTDITAAKRVEAALMAAREEAVAASEAKSNFLSSMSHEIRTPMNAMLGMADLLWETRLTAEQRRFLDSIRRNSNALLDLINGILDLAKVESGRLSLEWIVFDLRELAERVVETLGVKAHQKWLELAVRIAPSIPTELVGDPLRLRQILMNLVGNAIKFTEHGEVVLEIEPCERESSHPDRAASANGSGNGVPQQHNLRFLVRDTGIGIEANRIGGIFATFTQAASSTARKYGGSGLGLAIVKRLVEVMGGALSVVSEPGHGSVFSFVVPFQLPPTADTVVNPAAPWLRPGFAEAPTSDRTIAPDLGGRRVLVADDTPINRTSLREMLAARGGRVDEAANGAGALAMVSEALEGGDPYALALIDGRMPGLDGIETARRLLRDDEMIFRCGAAILMVTSDALNPTLARCRQLGLDRMRTFSYVVKPVRMAELAEAIKQVIFTGADGAAPPGDDQETSCDTPLPMTLPGGSANRSKDLIKVRCSAGNGKTKPLKILMAEDSPDNCMLIEAYFNGTNYTLDIVENGERAVERFTHGVYDVVLMDIHMPVMDGYTATRQIRAWEKANDRERTPVMALTASAQEEAIRESLEAGCDSHLAKPVRRKMLLQAIEDITARKHSGASSEAVRRSVTHKNGYHNNVVHIDADLSDLVPNFLAHKRDDARTIAAAIEMGDYATLSQLGHKMKGEGGSYGFDAITTMGAGLEDAAKVKDQVAARHWATELATFLDTLEVVYA